MQLGTLGSSHTVAARQAKHHATRHEQKHIEDANAHVDAKQCFRASLSEGKYMALPTDDEIQGCVAQFIDATGNKAVAIAVCVVCACEMMANEGVPMLCTVSSN